MKLQRNQSARNIFKRCDTQCFKE